MSICIFEYLEAQETLTAATGTPQNEQAIHQTQVIETKTHPTPETNPAPGVVVEVKPVSWQAGYIDRELDEAGLTVTEFRIHCYVAHAGQCYDQPATIADFCGVSRRGVQNALHRLLQKGLIKCRIRKGKSTVYSTAKVRGERLASIPRWLHYAGFDAHQFRYVCHIIRRGQLFESLPNIEKLCRMKRERIQREIIPALLERQVITVQEALGATNRVTLNSPSLWTEKMGARQNRGCLPAQNRGWVGRKIGATKSPSVKSPPKEVFSSKHSLERAELVAPLVQTSSSLRNKPTEHELRTEIKALKEIPFDIYPRFVEFGAKNKWEFEDWRLMFREFAARMVEFESQGSAPSAAWEPELSAHP